MKISTAAREYLIEIEVRKFTPKTIRSYRNNLNLFLRYCETEAQITEALCASSSYTHTETIFEYIGKLSKQETE